MKLEEKFKQWYERLTQEALTLEEIQNVYSDIRSSYLNKGLNLWSDLEVVFPERLPIEFLFIVAFFYKFEIHFVNKEGDKFAIEIKAPDEAALIAQKFSRSASMKVFVEDLRKYGFGKWGAFFGYGIALGVQFANEMQNRKYDRKALRKDWEKAGKRNDKLQQVSSGGVYALGLGGETKSKQAALTARMRYFGLMVERLTQDELTAWQSYFENLNRLETRAKEEPLFLGILIAFCVLYQKQWGVMDNTFLNPVITDKPTFFYEIYGRPLNPYEQKKAQQVLDEFQGFDSNGVTRPFLRSVTDDKGMTEFSLNPFAVKGINQFFLIPYHELHKAIKGKENTFKIACERFVLHLAIHWASCGNPLIMCNEDLRLVMLPKMDKEKGTRWVENNKRLIFNTFVDMGIISTKTIDKTHFKIIPYARCFSAKPRPIELPL